MTKPTHIAAPLSFTHLAHTEASSSSAPTQTEEQVPQVEPFILIHAPWYADGKRIISDAKRPISFLSRAVSKLLDAESQECLLVDDVSPLKALHSALKAHLEILTEIDEAKSDRWLTRDELEDCVTNIHKEVSDRLSTTGADLYFPVGWHRTTSQKGHRFLLHLNRIDGAHVRCTLMNLGAGAESHVVTGYNQRTYLQSYCDHPVDIPWEVFSGAGGYSFLHRMIDLLGAQRLASTSNIDATHSIYDVLKILGRVEPLEDPSRFEAEPQFHNSCSTRVALLLAQDVLLRAGKDKAYWSRFMLDVRQLSLEEAANSTPFFEQEGASEAFEVAVKRFAVEIETAFTDGVISESERQLLSKRAETIKNSLTLTDSTDSPSLGREELPRISPKNVRVINKKTLPFPRNTNLIDRNAPLTATATPASDATLWSSPFYETLDSLETLLDYTKFDAHLAKLVSRAEELHDQEERVAFISEALLLLPSPKSTLWDDVPIEDIHSVTPRLRQLGQQLLASAFEKDVSLCALRRRIALMTLLTTADRLTCRLSSASLEEFHLPFYYYGKGELPTFLDGKLSTVYWKNVDYLKEQREKRPKKLCEFSCNRNFFQAVQKIYSADADVKSDTYFLRYLLQFLPEETTDNEAAIAYEGLWLNEEGDYPRSVSHLLALAGYVYATHRLGIGGGYEEIESAFVDFPIALATDSDYLDHGDTAEARNPAGTLQALHPDLASCIAFEGRENEALLERVNGATVGSSRAHDLLRLAASPSLALEGALLFLSDNVDLLGKEPEWIGVLQRIFLHRRELKRRAGQNPDFIDGLRKQMIKVLCFYEFDLDQRNLFLLLFQLSYSIEGHLYQAQRDQYDGSQLTHLRQILLRHLEQETLSREERYAGYLHLLLSYGHLRRFSNAEEAAEFAHAFCLVQSLRNPFAARTLLESEAEQHSFFRLQSSLRQQALIGQEAFSEKLSELLAHSFHLDRDSFSLQGMYPHYFHDSLTVDLRTGKVDGSPNFIGQFDRGIETAKPHLPENIAAILGEYKGRMRCHDMSWESDDSLFKLAPTSIDALGRITRYRAFIRRRNDSPWNALVERHEIASNDTRDFYRRALPESLLVYGEASDTEPEYVLFYDRARNKIEYQFIHTPEGTTVTRLDPGANPLPEALVKGSEALESAYKLRLTLQTEASLNTIFDQFARYLDIVFYNHIEQRPGYIQFGATAARFELEGDRYRSLDLDDFFLVWDLEERLNLPPHSHLVKNDDEEFRVLLPLIPKPGKKPCDFIILHYNPETGVLSSRSEEARLTLALYYTELERFSEALQLLNSISLYRPWTQDERRTLLAGMRAFGEGTPEATSLANRFSLLLLSAPQGGKETQNIGDVEHLAVQLYRRYLNIIGVRVNSPLSPLLQLRREEEIQLLTYFKPLSLSSPFRQLFNQRLHSLTSNPENLFTSVTAEVNPQRLANIVRTCFDPSHVRDHNVLAGFIEELRREKRNKKVNSLPRHGITNFKKQVSLLLTERILDPTIDPMEARLDIHFAPVNITVKRKDLLLFILRHRNDLSPDLLEDLDEFERVLCELLTGESATDQVISAIQIPSYTQPGELVAKVSVEPKRPWSSSETNHTHIHVSSSIQSCFPSRFIDQKRPAHPIPERILELARSAEDPIEREIYADELIAGHELYTQEHKQKLFYVLPEGATRDVAERVAAYRAHLVTSREARRQQIEELASSSDATGLDITRRTLQVVAGKLDPIRLTGTGVIAKALLERDLTPLIRRNPHLSDETAAEVMDQAVDYFIDSLKLILIELIEEALKKDDVDSAGRLAHWSFDMPPNEYIELLLFAHNMKRIPRKQQQELFLNLEKGKISSREIRQALVAMPVGSGKTHYIAPALRAKEPESNVEVVAQKLVATERQQQAVTMMEGWRHRVGAPELLLRERSKDDVDFFISKLGSSVMRREKLILTPETFHSLALHRKRARIQSRGDWIASTEAAIETLASMNRHIDEAREVLAAQTIIIEATGPGKAIDPSHINCLLDLLSPLLVEEGPLFGALRIRENQMAEVKPAQIDEIVESLGHYIIQNQPRGLNIPKELFAEALSYWKTGIRPVWLKEKKLGATSASLTVFIGQFLRTTLRVAATKKGGVDFNMERERGEDYKPWDYQRPTGADFLDPQLAMTITVIGLFQYGLRPFQQERLLRSLQQNLRKERKFYRTESECPTHQLYNSWKGGERNSLLNLRALPAELANDPAVLYWYLKQHVLPSIRIRNTYISSTAAHLLNLFGKGRTTLFSACPGAKEGYPTLGEMQIEGSASFQAEMVALFCAPENREVVHFASPIPTEVFRTLARAKPEKWEKLCALIDPGVICQVGVTPLDAARGVLTVAKETDKALDGVIYFSTEDKPMFLAATGGTVGMHLGGGSLPKALAEIGVDYEKVNLVVIFGPAQVIGTDVLLPDGGVCLLMEKPGATLSDRIQAAGRARGLRSELQTLVNGRVTPDAADEESALDLIMDVIPNEAKLRKEEILMTSVQTITYLIEEEALRLADSGELIPLENLEEELPLDPFDRYPELQKEVPTEDALEQIVATTLERFSITRENLSTEAEEHIASIITRTAHLIPQMDSFDPTTATTGETILATQQTNIQQQIDQNQTVESIGVGNLNLKAADDHRLTVITYLDTHADRLIADPVHTVPVQSLYPDCAFFGDDLYFSRGALELANDLRGPLRERVLRPIHYLWILKKENGEKVAIALSDLDAAHLAKLLPKICRKGILPESVLTTANGEIISRTKEEAMMPDAELDREGWFREILAQINLLRGEIHDYSALKARIDRYPDLARHWEGEPGHGGIREALVYADSPTLSIISQLIQKEPS